MNRCRRETLFVRQTKIKPLIKHNRFWRLLIVAHAVSPACLLFCTGEQVVSRNRSNLRFCLIKRTSLKFGMKSGFQGDGRY